MNRSWCLQFFTIFYRIMYNDQLSGTLFDRLSEEIALCLVAFFNVLIVKNVLNACCSIRNLVDFWNVATFITAISTDILNYFLQILIGSKLMELYTVMCCSSNGTLTRPPQGQIQHLKYSTKNFPTLRWISTQHKFYENVD
jgi:hypothetical protein